MTAVNRHIGYQNFNGRAMPVFVYLPVRAGSAQAIKRGEICKLTSLDLAGTPLAPAAADENGFVPLIAWEEQAVSDPARKLQFVLPTEGDLFRFPLATAATLRPGSTLEISDSQTLKSGSTHPVAVAWDVDQLYTAAGAGVSVSEVWVQFCRVTAADLINYPLVGLPSAVTVQGNLAHAVTDPGDAGAISVALSGVCGLVTGATGQTRTLAAPTVAGQQLALALKTDGGGDCVVTAAAAVNQAGNNTLTFSDAGEVILLAAVPVGAALVWRVQANDGVALSTV